MDLTRGDGRGTPNQRQAAHAPRHEDGDGGKKKLRMADLELDVFHNPELLAYLGWEQQQPPWLVATAMKCIGFPHFDRLWPPTSHEQHCKSRDAKYLHLKDVEVKWQFLTILWAIFEQTKWPKGSIPRSIASMMYAEHVLRVDVDWSTFHTEGFGAIGPGLLAKRPIHIPYVPVPEWFRTIQNFMWIRKHKKGLRGRWGVQRADGGRGHVGDGLPLPEWEPFARLVAPVAEGVQTDVDATRNALREQHDIDVHAYNARIEHLETVLASLGICEPLELLPSTGRMSTSRSVHNDQYTTDIITEN